MQSCAAKRPSQSLSASRSTLLQRSTWNEESEIIMGLVPLVTTNHLVIPLVIDTILFKQTFFIYHILRIIIHLTSKSF